MRIISECYSTKKNPELFIIKELGEGLFGLFPIALYFHRKVNNLKIHVKF